MMDEISFLIRKLPKNTPLNLIALPENHRSPTKYLVGA